METANCFSKTFLVTDIFSPKKLEDLYMDLDDQVNNFISERQAELELSRKEEETDYTAKKITITAVNDNLFFFKEGVCGCKSPHPCDFGISRVIICLI